MLLKCCTQYASKFLKLSGGHRTGKVYFSFQSLRKAMTKNAQSSPREASTVCELRNSRCSRWIQKRQKNKRSNYQNLFDYRKSKRIPKNFYICFIEYTKVLDCVDHKKMENSESDGNTRPPYLPPEKPVCRSRSNISNCMWDNRLVPNWEWSTSRVYIVSLLI